MATVQRKTDSKAPRKPAVTSEILDRQPPRNLDAEKGVLGSILLLPQVCDDVALILRPEDFYDDANRTLFAHLLDMHDSGKRIDMTLLVNRLRTAGEYDLIGGAAYLADITRSVPTAAHATYYAEIVRDKAMLRALIESSTEILRDAYDESSEARHQANLAEQRIFAVLDKRQANQVIEARDLIHEALARIDLREKGEHKIAGVDTGFNDLDSLTGGLHNSELNIIAARPSMGKTAFALNIAEYVSSHLHVPTLVVSLEMSSIELADRMLCSQARVNGQRLRTGRTSLEDRQKIVEACSVLSQAPLFVDDSSTRTVTEISAVARRLKRRSGLGLIVIDYLQLIEPDSTGNSRENRQEQVARIARRLKGMARELSIPVVCLAQLNRQAEETYPRLSHLRESGAIEQDADVVMFIHREDYYMTPEQREKERQDGDPRELLDRAQIIIAKQRNGPIGEVKLFWKSEFTRFENLAQRPYDEFEQYAEPGGAAEPF
jgi:replicative DNA helicase